MSPKEIVFSQLPLLPSRRKIIDDYIDTFSERDTYAADAISREISESPLPLAATQVLIPVAAHQETAQIPIALAQYAKQIAEPFSVILSLNSPIVEHNIPQIHQTIDAIELARKNHPQLDVRMALSFYDKPTIGMIRRNLWNAALKVSREQGLYDNERDEVIGINHDIDVIDMSPRYIQRIQTCYADQRESCSTKAPLGMARTGIRHALSPDHPNISKGVLWADFTNRQIDTSYEAGLVFPLSLYAQRGGFDSNDVTHETYQLSLTTKNTPHIPGTAMQTSPRRYIERFKYGYDNVWTNESFGADDNCRDSSLTRADVSFSELEEIIDRDDRIRETIFAMAVTATLHYPQRATEMAKVRGVAAYDRKIRADLQKHTHTQIHLASEVLARVIASSSLAAKARALHDDGEFHDQLDRLFTQPYR